MLRDLQSAFAIVALLAASACGEKTAAEPATATSTSAATSGDGVGVPECDEYITKYQACVTSKVPEAARASLVQSVDSMRTAWKAAAGTAEGKASLAAACKQAREAAKGAMGAYGCTDF